MALRNLELLLIENVDNLGIVGDVVKVRDGYARNFLLPRQLATTPNPELLKSLAAKRAEAERMLSEQRSVREGMIQRMTGIELVMTRACNDQGVLYGAVTQQEISAAMNAAGYGIRPRDVRIHGAIKRVDTYDVLIKFEADLEAHIKLKVDPDRTLEKEEREEMDFDNEGNLVQPGARGKGKDRDRDGEGGGGGKGGRNKYGGGEAHQAVSASLEAPRKTGWGASAPKEKAEAGAPKAEKGGKGGKDSGESAEPAKKASKKDKAKKD